MVDRVVGEELSEPILEARLDVILEVKLDAKGFTVENIEFCICKNPLISALGATFSLVFIINSCF